MDMRMGLALVAALMAGAIGGGVVTTKFVPSVEGSSESAAQVGDRSALDAALKEAAEARAEALHWEGEADRLAKQLANGPESADPTSIETVPFQAVGEVAEVKERTPTTMDAAMLAELEAYRAQDRERQERERQREERNAERREEWAERQVDMLNQRTDMFTELIDRTNDPGEKQRWADIERNMTLSRDIMRQMREADTDEERAAARDAMRQNFESTQNLLRQQQTATLKRSLAAEGIGESQISQIQRAVETSLSDEAYRMSAFGGGRGFGGPRRGGGSRGPGGGGSGGYGFGRGR